MELSFTETGSGRPLVILHGLFGAGRNWATIARRLGAVCRVVSVDLRNHGNAPWADTMTYPEMADDVARLIEAAGLDGAVVMGHSMGGKVAMTLALTQPEMPGALIVVDAAPVAYPRVHDGVVRAMLEIDLSAGPRRGEIDTALARDIPDAAVRAFLLSNLVRDGDGLRWRLNLAAIEESLDTISGIPAPFSGATWAGRTLFLTGADSDYVRDEHHGAIRGLFPSADFAMLEGAGHWVHADQPDAFVAAVTNFLETI